MIETAAFSLWTGAEGFEKHLTRSRLDFWILSVCLAARVFPRIILNTDDRGAELLSERLNLPFTEVRTGLNAVPSRLSYLYPVGKLFTYRELAAEGVPFLHLDEDFLLWEDARWREIREAPSVCQDYHCMKPILRDFCLNSWRDDPLLKGYAPTFSVCAGALGGNDVKCLLEYAEKALDLATNPTYEGPARAFRARGMAHIPTCMMEEALFAFYFPDGACFTRNRIQTTEEEWVEAGISHSMGRIKDSLIVKKRHERYARLGFPEYTARADALKLTLP